MEKNHIPITCQLIEKVSVLINTPLKLNLLKNLINEFKWTIKGAEYEYFYIEIPNHTPFMVQHNNDDISCMINSFYYWEDFSNIEGRDEFDEDLENSRIIISDVLGEPFIKWQDQDEDRHSAYIWKGEYAYLILQQAVFDCQYGLEINLWLEKRNDEDFTPKSPLCDWLMERNKMYDN